MSEAVGKRYSATEKQQKAKEDKQQAMKRTKELLSAKKAVDQAIHLTNPLQDFQEAMRANPEQNVYVQQINALLIARTKDMLKEAMDWLTTEETERVIPSFKQKDAKVVMTDLVTKTRMLICL